MCDYKLPLKFSFDKFKPENFSIAFYEALDQSRKKRLMRIFSGENF